MFSLIGIGIVIAAVLGGYLLHHGKIEVLIQPNEFLIIWGAALGSMVISTPMPVLLRLLKSFGKILSAGRFSRKYYLESLQLLNELFQTALPRLPQGPPLGPLRLRYAARGHHRWHPSA
jgi:chemotaxis protein MotA